MLIENNKIVTIEYTLKDKDGKLLDSSESSGPLEYLHGHNNIIPGLEKALEGKRAGDTVEAVIEPKDAYGEYDPKLVTEVPPEQFDASVKVQVGMSFQASSNAGPVIVHVTKVADDKITVDANHELAGQTLYFNVAVKDVRDATAEQIANGSPYTGGCGGGCSSCGGSCGGGCGGGSCGSGGCSEGCGSSLSGEEYDSDEEGGMPCPCGCGEMR